MPAAEPSRRLSSAAVDVTSVPAMLNFFRSTSNKPVKSDIAPADAPPPSAKIIFAFPFGIATVLPLEPCLKVRAWPALLYTK